MIQCILDKYKEKNILSLTNGWSVLWIMDMYELENKRRKTGNKSLWKHMCSWLHYNFPLCSFRTDTNMIICDMIWPKYYYAMNNTDGQLYSVHNAFNKKNFKRCAFSTQPIQCLLLSREHLTWHSRQETYHLQHINLKL